MNGCNLKGQKRVGPSTLLWRNTWMGSYLWSCLPHLFHRSLGQAKDRGMARRPLPSDNSQKSQIPWGLLQMAASQTRGTKMHKANLGSVLWPSGKRSPAGFQGGGPGPDALAKASDGVQKLPTKAARGLLQVPYLNTPMWLRSVVSIFKRKMVTLEPKSH